MYPQADGTTLEKGRMVNPATGRDTEYDELWTDRLAPASDVVAVLRVDDGKVKGLMVWIGGWCQALVRDAEQGVALERWERHEDEAWTRTVRMGTRGLPCEGVLMGEVELEREGVVGCEGDVWEVIELSK